MSGSSVSNQIFPSQPVSFDQAGKVDPFLRLVPLHWLVGGGRKSAPADAAPGDDLEVAKGALAKPPKAEIDAGGWIPRLVRKAYAPLFDSKIFALAVVRPLCRTYNILLSSPRFCGVYETVDM